MHRRPPRSKRTDPLFPYPTLERQDPYVGLADLRPLQVQAFGLAHPGVDEQLPPPALRAGGHVELRQVRRRIELGRLLLLAQLSDRLLRPWELPDPRSEERRVGKEWASTGRTRWSRYL